MPSAHEELTLEQFLAAPVEIVRHHAPATVVYATGGTRRRAILEGLDITSDAYVQWTRTQMIDGIDLLFSHGVKHVFVPILVDGNFQARTQGYSEKLLRWIDHGISGPDALADYAQRGWQVRLSGAELLPPLQGTAARLRAETAASTERCVWFTATPSSEAAWELVFRRIVAEQAFTYRAAVRAVYGQEIPTDDVLLLDFGKPQVYASAVPPLLVCKMHCYWRQTLGYTLTSDLLRRVFYDYAFNRTTWRSDKSGRADEVRDYAHLYAEPPLLGEGMRLGPFWFPRTPNGAP
jgi:hypothetical protein